MVTISTLEDMVVNVSNEVVEIAPETINRWQKLFGFSAAEAEERIEGFRADVYRTPVCDDLWDMVKAEKPGYDKEAYEFEISYLRGRQSIGARTAAVAVLRPAPVPATYLVKLAGPLDSAIKVQEAAGLGTVPEVRGAETESGEDANVCIINATSKVRIQEWLLAHDHIYFKPTFIRVSQAPKHLLNFSLAPTIGIDATLPQHRPDTDDIGVLQDQYPVWCFCYGNLAKEEILVKLLSLTSPPEYHNAQITGGVIKRWAGKYNALVDGPISSLVHGCAYKVMSKEHEDLFRFHETEVYEVVRCNILISGKLVAGLTFRYAGPPAQLA